MIIINLREHYPDYYAIDTYMEVSDEVAAAMVAFNRREAAFQERTRYHRAYYSLDMGDGIEHHAISRTKTPWEICEHKLTTEQLYAALNALPNKQAERIYAYFFLRLTKEAIAKNEKVSTVAIHHSICRGLRSMKRFLKKFE